MRLLDECNLLRDDARDCAESFVRTWLGRLGRRAVAEGDVADYLAIYDAFADEGHTRAIRVVLQAMLQSPWFLYHHELPAGDAAGGPLRPLDGHAVASRLAFFLWAAGPDDVLLADAAAGRLDTAAGVSDATARLLADPRAARGLGELHLEWLGVDRLDEVVKDPEQFPDHDQVTRDAMVADVVDYVDAILRHGDGSWRSLLAAPHDIGRADGEPARIGLLTLPAVLAVHGHYQRSSLSLRGSAGAGGAVVPDVLPDPPPDVDIRLPDDVPVGGHQPRDRRGPPRRRPPAAAAMAFIDPIGFAFEPWDAVGRFRETLHSVSPSIRAATLSGTDVDGDFADAEELVLGSRREPPGGVVRDPAVVPLRARSSRADRRRLLPRFGGLGRDGPAPPTCVSSSSPSSPPTPSACRGRHEPPPGRPPVVTLLRRFGARGGTSRSPRSCPCRRGRPRPVPIRRLVLVFTPHGTVLRPAGCPTALQRASPSPSSAHPRPLERHRDHLVVLDGLRHRRRLGGCAAHQGLTAAVDRVPAHRGPDLQPRRRQRRLLLRLEQRPLDRPGDRRRARAGLRPSGRSSSPCRAQATTTPGIRLIYRAPAQPLAPEDDPHAMFARAVRRRCDESWLSSS